MEKVGSLLGIVDAESAASLQQEITALAREQEEQLDQRQRVNDLSSRGSGHQQQRQEQGSHRPLSTPTTRTSFWKPSSSSAISISITNLETVGTPAAATPTRRGKGWRGGSSGSMFGRLLRGVSSSRDATNSSSTSSMSMSLPRPGSSRFRPRASNNAPNYLPSRDLVLMGSVGGSNGAEPCQWKQPQPEADAPVQPEQRVTKPKAQGFGAEEEARRHLADEESPSADERPPKLLDSLESKEEETDGQIQARAEEAERVLECGPAGLETNPSLMVADLSKEGDNVSAADDVAEGTSSLSSQASPLPAPANASAEGNPCLLSPRQMDQGPPQTGTSNRFNAGLSLAEGWKLGDGFEGELREGERSNEARNGGISYGSDDSGVVVATAAARQSPGGQSRGTSGGTGDAATTALADADYPSVRLCERDDHGGGEDGARAGTGLSPKMVGRLGEAGDGCGEKGLGIGEAAVTERDPGSEFEGIDAGEECCGDSAAGDGGGDSCDAVAAPDEDGEDEGHAVLTPSLHTHLTPALCEVRPGRQQSGSEFEGTDEGEECCADSAAGDGGGDSRDAVAAPEGDGDDEGHAVLTPSFHTHLTPALCEVRPGRQQSGPTIGGREEVKSRSTFLTGDWTGIYISSRTKIVRNILLCVVCM